MIAQRRGRVSFCSAGRTRSPGEDHCSTLSAQDHSSFNRSVLLLSSPSFSSFQFQYFKSFAWHGAGGPGAWWGCSEHSASGQGGSGWPSLPPPGIGRGAGRQRLHIFSGRQKLRMLQSLAAGVPWVQLACWPAAWVVVDKYGWWNSQRGSLYTGDGNQPPQQSFLGGTVRSVQRQAHAEGPPGMSGVDSGRPPSAGTQGRPVVVSGVGRRFPSCQSAVNTAILSGLAMGHGRQFGGDLRQLFHSPKSGLGRGRVRGS
jgi:hypothetical protein